MNQPPARWCPICGRTREGVWPFQYMVKPESWDGAYHDEGGGPTRQDGIRDWWRDILFKRYRKRNG